MATLHVFVAAENRNLESEIESVRDSAKKLRAQLETTEARIPPCTFGLPFIIVMCSGVFWQAYYGPCPRFRLSLHLAQAAKTRLLQENNDLKIQADENSSLQQAQCDACASRDRIHATMRACALRFQDKDKAERQRQRQEVEKLQSKITQSKKELSSVQNALVSPPTGVLTSRACSLHSHERARDHPNHPRKRHFRPPVE